MLMYIFTGKGLLQYCDGQISSSNWDVDTSIEYSKQAMKLIFEDVLLPSQQLGLRAIEHGDILDLLDFILTIASLSSFLVFYGMRLVGAHEDRAYGSIVPELR